MGRSRPGPAGSKTDSPGLPVATNHGPAGGKTGSPGLPVAGLPVAGLPVAPAVHCVTTTFFGTPKVV